MYILYSVYVYMVTFLAMLHLHKQCIAYLPVCLGHEHFIKKCMNLYLPLDIMHFFIS